MIVLTPPPVSSVLDPSRTCASMKHSASLDSCQEWGCPNASRCNFGWTRNRSSSSMSTESANLRMSGWPIRNLYDEQILFILESHAFSFVDDNFQETLVVNSSP